MSIIDKALGAITPPESDEKRAEATARARAAAQGDDWLSLALDHHDLIRAAFEACRTATQAHARVEAMEHLGRLLAGHSIAEEVVLYPALAKAGEKTHAGMAYTEQTTAKMQMAELERIDPATPEWADKLEHLRGAVLHHIFEEEGSWFLKIKAEYDDQAHLTRRFREEAERHVETAVRPAESRSFAAGQAVSPDGIH
ncbi:hemerythrin domain-containing protein [Phenylobacterium sp. J426]|uniref:hemerythrin domain-containing protein n=1 Tax=Phenylobacterium sp. J426 TaxID=2898439 RepID=UPI002150E357|nr:hemerythrin domain-containing protein [Phenylobacterium sp. J426]MCR5875050.1 hemerythrin domain-containing protein [Phenylobacterium sp. J426]